MSGCWCLILPSSKLEAAKIILCASTCYPSSQASVTPEKSFLHKVRKWQKLTLSYFSHSNLISRCFFLCLKSAPFAISKSQTLHLLVSWTFITCCLKMIPLMKVFYSQLVHFDSFFLWCSLKCLWKRSELLKAFPHSGHNLSFSMFMAQRI